MKQFLFALAILLGTTTAYAEVKVTVQKEYYDVPGRRKDEIIRSMEKHAPYRKGKFFVPAFIQPKLRYKFSLKQKDGRCAVDEVIVHLDIVYKYPRLSEKPANKYASDWWSRQINGLITHEEVHGDIAIRGAHRFEKKLLSLDNMNCATAKQHVMDTANTFNQLTITEQKDYDSKTKHGIRQFLYKGPSE